MNFSASYIGKVLENQLNDLGIETVDELIDIGSKEAWSKIKEIDESACLNRLMALEGANRIFAGITYLMMISKI